MLGIGWFWLPRPDHIFLCIRRLPGQYGANIQPIAVSSGLNWSAEPNACIDALGTLLVHRHGHQNRQRVRCICLLSISCMLAVARAIRSEYSTNYGDQWLKLKRWAQRICWCAWYHTGASPWPSKPPASEMHLFAINILYAGGRRGDTEQILNWLWRPVA